MILYTIENYIMAAGWKNRKGQFYHTLPCVASPKKLHCNGFEVSKCLILFSNYTTEILISNLTLSYKFLRFRKNFCLGSIVL